MSPRRRVRPTPTPEQRDRWNAERRLKYQSSEGVRKLVHHNNSLRKYGVSGEEYESLLSYQNGVCAICGKPPEKKKLGVDHDHVSNRIRGLLCKRCNSTLGLVNDDVRLLDALKEYLERQHQIWFTTVNGRRIDLSFPKVEDIDVADIACGLSRVCRYTGQLRDFYSVAQHAMMVAELVDEDLRLAALHHDDSEAYMNDLPRNLKHSAGLAGYRGLEARLTTVIERAFGINLKAQQRCQIKAADDLLAIYERITLRHHDIFDAAKHVDESLADGFVSKPERRDAILLLAARIPAEWHDFPFTLTPAVAEQKFLERHRIYGATRG